jgi:multidrug efflux pump subunit AcrA (membrane-fusion protein)
MMIVQLVNPTLLELVVNVDEIDIPKVTTGQKVQISVDALPNQEFTGEVSAIYPVPSKVTGLVLYNVKVEFSVTENSRLQIGMRATADITVDEAINVIKVPSKSVKEDDQGGYFVDVLVERKVEKRPVTIGISNDTETEIITGLDEGEPVLH